MDDYHLSDKEIIRYPVFASLKLDGNFTFSIFWTYKSDSRQNLGKTRMPVLVIA